MSIGLILKIGGNMRAVVQRVKSASVMVDRKVIGSIEKGLLIFLGVEEKDDDSDLNYILDKTTGLRIFEDEDEKMNLSILDVKGEILVVSQFTLYGDVRKGKRPSFSTAARPDKGNEYYLKYIEEIKTRGIVVETGQFGADMDVQLINDGPVTILLDSHKNF